METLDSLFDIMVTTCAAIKGEHFQIFHLTRFEQLIDWLENHAGIIENLDDPSTVPSEQVIRPELARLFIDFEGTIWLDDGHEQYSKFQSDYKSVVITLVDAFEQLGNPFWEDATGLRTVNLYVY